MSTRTRGKGGPRPAEPELPPTLLPNAVRCAAPPPSRRLSAALSCIAYMGCAGLTALMANAKLDKPYVPPTKPDDGYVVDIGERPPDPPAFQAPSPVTRVDAKPPAGDVSPLAAMVPGEEQIPETPNGRFPTEPVPVQAMTGSGGGSGPGVRGPDGGPQTPHVVGVPTTTGVIHDIAFDQVRVLHQEPANYPILARMARIEGTVDLLVVVNEQGQPLSVQVLSGPPQLQGEAERCARLWRFEPARLGNQAITARFRLSLVFRLKR